MVALLLAGTACTSAAERARPSKKDIGRRGGLDHEASGIHRTAQIYAAVIRQLVLEDDTFGGPNPYFKRVFVLERVVPEAGDPLRSLPERTSGMVLSSEVKQEMLKLLSDLPPMNFISRRGAVIGGRSAKDPIGRVVHDGVLITLGPIRHTSGGVRVSNNLWVSGLAGQWLTYVLEKAGNNWSITGTTGPIAIS